MKRSGFTLIELLVVIAIIAILAAILFPVFAKSREKARTTACLNNCMQIGLALLQYAQDYDEHLPCMQPRGWGWGLAAQPYIRNSQCYVCGCDTTAPASNGVQYPISYAFNSSISYPINGYAGTGLLAALNAPAQTVLLLECTNGVWTPGGGETEANCSPGMDGYCGAFGDVSGNESYACAPIGDGNSQATGLSGGTYAPNNRHISGTNWAFADGHVKLLNPQAISAGLAAPSPTSDPADSGDGTSRSPWNATGTRNLTTDPNGSRAATFSPI
jgi:prepilin-type N-terminal cleavage/methylation domain-containing protein/prepilin-type processing-associated H-X9-DG protein